MQGEGDALWLKNFRFSFVIFIPVFDYFSDLYALKICLGCFLFFVFFMTSFFFFSSDLSVLRGFK